MLFVSVGEDEPHGVKRKHDDEEEEDDEWGVIELDSDLDVHDVDYRFVPPRGRCTVSGRNTAPSVSHV